MEQILDLLESKGKDAPVDDVEYAISKAEGLKEESKNLLRKERQDIIATAKAHGLSLEELGIKEEDPYDDDDDDDDSEEVSEVDLNTTLKRLRTENSISNPHSKTAEEQQKIDKIRQIINEVADNKNEDESNESDEQPKQKAESKKSNTSSTNKSKSAEPAKESENEGGCCLLL